MVQKWIVPCNPSIYDIAEHFAHSDEIVWKRTADGMSLGDDAYLYLSKPIGCVKYRCEVIEINVAPDVLASHQYAVPKGASGTEKYMRLILRHSFTSHELTFSFLKELGLGQLQRQARIYEPLGGVLQQMENDLSTNDLTE